MDTKIAPIFVISHPRSGTHMMIDLIRKQFSECRSWKLPLEYLDHVYLNLDHLSPYCGRWYVNEKTALRRLKRADRPVVKTHLLPDFKELKEHSEFVQHLWGRCQGIYMVRDVRDVICSMHLWMQEFSQGTHCSISDFMRQEEDGMNRVAKWAHHVNTWMAQEKVLVLKYEEVIHNTNSTIEKISTHIGLLPIGQQPLLPKRLKNQWHRRLERLLIHPETTAILGRYKGLKPVKWTQAFTADDKRFVNQYAGDLLAKLGYEITKE